MTIQPPPDYIVVPQEYLNQAYEPDKPRRALFCSFVRILSLAWQSKYKTTPKLNEDELMEYLKLSRRQYYEQKADMELVGWLRSSHPAPGFVQFTFGRPSIAPDQRVSAENRTASAEIPLVVGGESINSNLNSDSLPPLEGEASAENRTFPNVLEILRHTDKLFDGSVVLGRDLGDRSPLEALAWCTYAYAQKGKLDAPGGLVRKRLMENEPAPEWAKQQWSQVLPGDFLEPLGLIEYICDACQATFKTRSELEAHETTHPDVWICSECGEEFPEERARDHHYETEHLKIIPVDESVRRPIREGSMTPEQAWQSVLGQLQMEMPRASFDTWVRDAKVCRYHGNTLSIGVRNAYAREWLESRLASTVSRLLVGIMNASVGVEFVVWKGDA